MKGHVLAILLAALLGKSVAQTLTQSPISITRAPGKTARFECKYEGSDFDNTVIHWYRHIPHQRIQHILYFKSPSETEQDITDKILFADKNSATKTCSLSMKKIKEDDSGIYYCAFWARSGNEGMVFGSGSKLLVTGYNVREPKIQTFGPNETELDLNNRAAVVCLLTDFFPEVIRVQWIIGDKNAPSDQVLTDAVEKQENDAYSVVSRLIITKLEWTSQNISCRAEHETNPAKVTIPKESPGANLTP
nr:T-cell receptor gamma chain [Ginglymostoma cirratum]